MSRDYKSRFPSWLHNKLPKGNSLWETNGVIKKNCLNTVCEEAKCPNRLECFSKKTATFLAMGKECTRCCGFCNIAFTNSPLPLDPEEPDKIAMSVKQLCLKHVVITMVTRDDLPDGGALHLANIIKTIRGKTDTTIEVLTSDFNGNKSAYDIIIQAAPQIFNHNVETVEELSNKIRNKATYDRSLSLLKYIRDNSNNIWIKSGIMVGLGETKDQVQNTIVDLYHAGCDIITIGQYLQPNKNKLRVKVFCNTGSIC